MSTGKNMTFDHFVDSREHELRSGLKKMSGKVTKNSAKQGSKTKITNKPSAFVTFPVEAVTSLTGASVGAVAGAALGVYTVAQFDFLYSLDNAVIAGLALFGVGAIGGGYAGYRLGDLILTNI
jgi:hypothetical protein